MKKDKFKEYGEMAMELIREYPLYASTSNITYEEAIQLALVFYPDIKQWKEITEEV